MDYRNPAQCLGSLQNLPTDDPFVRFAELASIIAGLLDARPAPDQHLEVLEMARPLIDKTRSKLSGLDGDEPLPPDSQHNELLLEVIGLWHNYSRSYALIAEADDEAGVLEDQRALLAQRRVYYASKIVAEYYRAHRTLPAGLWLEVHASFGAAERKGLHQIRVSDSLNAIWKAQSALEAYITVLLLDLANPFSRSGQEWTWICRWAERFAPYCTLDPNIAERKPTTYGLDPAADHGLRPLGMLPKGSTPRYFDCNKLASQIQSVFTQFKQGVPPSSLGLGGDCGIEVAARLLLSLYRPWGLASAGRRFPRRGSTGEVELCAEWLAIGFHIQGKLFEQPRHDSLAAGDADDPYHDPAEGIFGVRAANDDRAGVAKDGKRDFGHQHLEAERLGLDCERWELLDQSLGGFRLQQRPHAERLQHNQVVGLRPKDGEYFLLGQVSWLMFRTDGLLEAGIRMLPGIPRVIAARQPVDSDESPREPYSQAFLIEANPKLQIGDSLIVPEGWYKTNGIIETFDNGHRLRMTQLLLKGPNFEQVSVTKLS
ncbi:MAG: hypothetical protein LBP86_09270 [Azoarcus sp.]|jgi:hypothetical protein|nr:hypothetical protein [Azoarcus sp.]